MTDQERREIEELIASVEQEGLLKAPRGMQQEVFKRMNESRQKKQKKQYVFYVTKVGLGMAAALYLLFSINLNMAAIDGQLLKREPAGKVSDRKGTVTGEIYKKSNEISRLLSQFADYFVEEGKH